MRHLILILTSTAILAAQSVESDVMLQRAMRKATVEGDLNGAIDLYKSVIADAMKNRAAAAKALLRLGECYEKQGNAEARRTYERLVREFSDQGDPAREAQVRLSAIGETRSHRGVMTELIARGPNINTEVRTTPDGRLLLFVDQESGNVAVRDIASGKVRRLTNDGAGTNYGQAHAHTPVPSRDGKQIAYIWAAGTAPQMRAEFRVISIDGSGMRTLPAKVKHGDSSEVLDWFPDGKSVLVYTVDRTDPGNVWTGFASVDLGTGVERRIVRTGYNPGSKALSADGRWLLFSVPLTARMAPWGILALDTQTGRVTPLLNGPASDRDAVWVPGSDGFAFRSDRNGKVGIWMARFKDGQIIGEPKLIKTEAGECKPVSITRDGFLFCALSQTSSNVYQATVDSSTMRVQGVPARIVESYLGHNTSPSWSPSGDSFGYYSDRDLTRVSRMVVHSSDGKETVIAQPVNYTGNPPTWCGGGDRLFSWLTPGPNILRLFDARTGEGQPDLKIAVDLKASYQWATSSDCKTIYVSSYAAATRRRRIYHYDIATGKEADVLTDAGEWALSPRVSPDGHWLALDAEPEGANISGLVVLPAIGGTMRMLDPDAEITHSWTPDSKRLMYIRSVKHAADQGTEGELYWVPVEGGVPQPMGIRMPGISVPSLNADGKRLIFSATESSNELWVLRNLPFN